MVSVRRHKKKNVVKPVEKSRKELRKEKRLQKKRNKALYYQKRKELAGKSPLKPKDEDSDAEVNEVQETEKIQIKKDLQKKKEKKKEKRKKQEEKKRKKQQLKEANLKEDKIIKQLEKRLKLNKRKSKSVPQSFVQDGLDYLLDFCDEENRSRIVETEKQLLGDDLEAEFVEDINMIKGDDSSDAQETEDKLSITNEDSMELESELENNKDDNEEDSEEENEVNSEHDDSDEDVDIKEHSKSRDKKKQESKCKNSSDEMYSEEEDMEDNVSQKSDNEEGIWEDIYGRKRDRQGNIVQSGEKYVPPAARLANLESNMNDEKLLRLRKQLKGFLNRLAEHNMQTISNQIDELYMSNSRNNMNQMLSKLMMESLISPVLTPDRLICEHMMLIAILHANIGTEVGAHFLLTFVKELDEMLKRPQDVEDKRSDNLVLMISHLYNFKVYGHKLLYQILENLANKFTEKEIELILLILRTVGFPLRKDDPVALKELILKLQNKASGTVSENSRVRFMLDVLLAIKNNNMSKIPQYDPSHVEHLKKLMKTLVRKGNAVTQFNVSLEDLLHADEKGKWWIVGSAWSGNNEVTKPMQIAEGNKHVFSQKMLELARKQRMNTDIRRNIFCVLMTAEDYLDAFEKLHHLGLKDQQEREVIYVIIDCCLQEKKFNPYYAVLAQKFCDYDRKYQMTIQYTLWDKLKALDSYNPKQLTNLARFLTHLFIEKGLPFSVLKVIEFAELDKQTMRLLRQIMLGVLLYENEEACMQVFERISLSPKLQAFRESLRLFVNHFLLKNLDSGHLPEADSSLLKRRAESVDRILMSRKVVF